MKATVSSPPDSGRSAWMGLDVSSARFDCALRFTSAEPVRPADLRKMPVHGHERTRTGLKKAVAGAKAELGPGDKLYMVMEATGHYSAEIAAWMKELFPDVAVTVMPALTIKSYICGIGLRNKTDKLDAKAIACYGAQCQPEPSAHHDELYLQLRALTRTIQVFAERSAEVANQAHANASDHVPAQIRRMIKKAHEQQMALLAKQRKGLESELKKIVDSDKQLSHDVGLLCTIKGVGFLSAVTVLGELGNLRHYKTSRQLTACAGLNPVIRQSGEKTGKSHVSKQGSSHVRRCLYLNAMVAIRHNDRLRTRYDKLTESGKPKKVALVANMRVLLTIMRALLINNTPYDPAYLETQNLHNCEKPDPENSEKKQEAPKPLTTSQSLWTNEEKPKDNKQKNETIPRE